MTKSGNPRPGDTLPERTIDAVSADAMAELAVILRDPNPIHLDREAVRAAGLGDRRINQGPANMAYVMDMLADALPDAELASMSIAFTTNVCEGDHVTASAEITDIIETEAGAVVDCAFQLDVRGGRPALKGTARLVPPRSDSGTEGNNQ